MTELFLGALQSTPVLLSVFLSLSPLEVDAAKTSWQKFPRVFDVRYYWYPLLAS